MDRTATITVTLDEGERPNTMHEVARIALECDDRALTPFERTDEGETWNCPNCGERHGPIDACLYGVVAGIVRDRGEVDLDPQKLEQLGWQDFWDRSGGPAADWLERALEASDGS